MEPREILSVDDIHLSEPMFWARPLPEREGAFASLRREKPISFHEEFWMEGFPFPRGPGYWALTRYHDILTVSRQPELFCSGQGSNIADLPPDFAEFFGSMINMDDPRHARLRRIVSRGFTPRRIQQVEDNVQRSATRIIDDVADKGEVDFVTEIAAALPLKIICDLMGIPESEYRFIFDRTNIILGAGDPEYVSDPMAIVPALLQAGAELSQLVQELGRERIKNPTDDLTSALVNAEVDGEKLTEQELGSFFVLLVVAGNETTRNAISHGMKALTDYPDQQARWASDFERYAPTAVEEIVRWATPVIHFRRTATRDTELSGQKIGAGQKVVLWYCSGNRDEAIFPDPFRFDIGREPNEHVGFGGPGPHFCLGAHLARREITVMFREIFRRLPDIHAVSEPDRLQSFFIHGIKHLRCQFTAGGR
ncbi:MAG TPA: cytochrome P450 [Terriglobales bacterium]|nr:cytochrome P450 [Terriglobales bacterium]